MTALHVFDMDGTLLPGTTASVEIARAFGRLPELLDLERAFAAGGLTTYEFALAARELYAGLTSEQVRDIFERCKWIDGIEQVMADIRARGEWSLVVTMSPNFFADFLLTKGVHEVRASSFPPLPITQLPHEHDILTPADKVRIVDEVRGQLGLDLDRCVGYGDSGSDTPLFHHLPYSVAVNATPSVRAIATVSADCSDLRVAYRAGRACLDDGGRD